MTRAALLSAMLLWACRGGREHVVVMRAMTFEPPVLTVSAGDRVVWRNEDIVPHTATASGRFDSGAVEPGQTFAVTLRTAGELSYACTLHPMMVGSIAVR